MISNKNPLGFFAPTLKFTVTKFTLVLLEKLFIAKLYFTASIFEAAMVLQIKDKQKKSRSIAFGVKSIGKSWIRQIFLLKTLLKLLLARRKVELLMSPCKMERKS